MSTQVVTYKYRIKDSSHKSSLKKMSFGVNFVWNYCKEIDLSQLGYCGKFMSGFDFQKYTNGVSKDIGVPAKTIQKVGHEYALKRKQFKKQSLSWRSSKRSLGWIPFDKQQIRNRNGVITFAQRDYKLFYSQTLDDVEILGGTFTEDSKGNWFINLQVRRQIVPKQKTGNIVGIDLGLKTVGVTSDGEELSRPNYTKLFAEKLVLAQKAKKKKQITSIYQKIKNKRDDWNKKTAAKLVEKYDYIAVGNVKSMNIIKKNNMAKSVYDAAWYGLKSALVTTAIKRGVDLHIVKESYSTVTCSTCKQKTGPSGLSGLDVREWKCSSCGTVHNRDVNAAKNILANSVQGIAPQLRESYELYFREGANTRN